MGDSKVGCLAAFLYRPRALGTGQRQALLLPALQAPGRGSDCLGLKDLSEIVQ